MKPELLDKLFEVRSYFLNRMPVEGEIEQLMLDYLDEVLDEVTDK